MSTGKTPTKEAAKKAIIDNDSDSGSSSHLAQTIWLLKATALTNEALANSWILDSRASHTSVSVALVTSWLEL